MTNQVDHVTIIGLPKSGKTTFIAALWHVLMSEDVDGTKLALDCTKGNVKHLNTIADCWRKCEEVPRTATNGENVYIHVLRTDTKSSIQIGLPDLSGETFEEHQIGNRQCTKEYFNDLEKDGGIMLFITADGEHNNALIRDMAFLSSEDALSEPQPWNHRLIPKAVKLIELLQFLLYPPFNNRIKRKLAIVISAWDVVIDAGENISPTDWFCRIYPMLNQFLLCNNDMFEYRIYGISAQGGDVTKEKDTLLAKVPGERIRCYGENVDLHDITAPIHWLMRE